MAKKRKLGGFGSIFLRPAPVLATNWGAFESNTGAGKRFYLGDCLKEKKLSLHSGGIQNKTASCPCVRLKYFFNLWLTQGQAPKLHQKNTYSAEEFDTNAPSICG